jgi:hypothetical protein
VLALVVLALARIGSGPRAARPGHRSRRIIVHVGSLFASVIVRVAAPGRWLMLRFSVSSSQVVISGVKIAALFCGY